MARVIRGPEDRDPVALLGALERARAQALDELADQLVDLAGAIARRAVLDAVATDPGAVRELARQALDRVRRATQIELRVHPDDVPRLDGLDVTVRADPALSVGDCVVGSELGEVDGRIETRIDRVLDALRSHG